MNYSTGALMSHQCAIQEQQINQAAAVPNALTLTLDSLFRLQESLRNAVDRSRIMADALFGAQPSPLNKIEPKSAPVEPSTIQKLANAQDVCHELAQELHVQLNRLERL